MNDFEISKVHLLLVEDNEGYLEREIRRLKKFGYQHIDTATTVREAKDKLANKHFDVIVADMRLDKDDGEGKNDNGGFAILDEVKQNNITSVVIILTISNAFEDCRKALKHNSSCWDYISKAMQEGDKSGLEELHDSIQAALTHWSNHKDKEWVAENKETLLEQYAAKHIAVLNNVVIAYADTEKELKQQITEHKLPLLLPLIVNLQAYSTAAIVELIQQEENKTLEFKESFWYDSTEPNNKKDALRFKTLKTIVAFLNTEGGTLLIGITNDKGIYGIENDFSILGQKKNKDGFASCLDSLIKSYIGTAFVKFITIEFVEIEGKTICAVVVKKSTQIAFFKDKDNKKKLYLRTSNGSQIMDDAEQMCKHLRMLNSEFEC